MSERTDLSEAFRRSLMPEQAAYAITEEANRTFHVWYLVLPRNSDDWNAGSWSTGHADYFRALFTLLAAVQEELKPR
jgi:hypothetical protein